MFSLREEWLMGDVPFLNSSFLPEILAQLSTKLTHPFQKHRLTNRYTLIAPQP